MGVGGALERKSGERGRLARGEAEGEREREREREEQLVKEDPDSRSFCPPQEA